MMQKGVILSVAAALDQRSRRARRRPKDLSIANPRSRHAEARDPDFEVCEFNGASKA
jgi:hypothetical protein